MNPGYPTGSFLYLEREDNEGTGANTPSVKLQIAVVGAGVGGLSAAIALRRDGHDVTVFESTPVLSEIGAGIQVPPNSTRILHSWGLEAALRKISMVPRSLLWRRWENGKVIGNSRFNPECQELFGSPYYVTHRAHLHEILHQKAVELGVVVRLASRVEKYNPDEPSFDLAGGETVKADLVVAADGVKSLARKTLLGTADSGLRNHGLAVYRATVKVEEMLKNEKTAPLVESPNLHLWVGGNDYHTMAYRFANDKLLNLVVTHPAEGEPETWNGSDHVADMRRDFKGWDPALTTLMDMVQTATKWPLRDIQVPERWSSASRKLILTGDAAHAMLPFMASGAAMAVEDAVALAESLRFATRKDMVPQAVAIFEQVRIPRVKQVHEASVKHGYTLHLSDGPEQQSRDKAMEKEVNGEHFISSPNQWSDPTILSWLYPYKPAVAVRKAWTERGQKGGNQMNGVP
ncbi:hypothetical protein PV04_04747 [Phialophora macrospora]|uniref:FAD-binding domain-containing protein n=1 Tax=Phialophora macrospora TaxID=1851006 RepID=A0A0D2E3A4_9EURO|nr:hypothetical protein PV04_04747 [Phialophora macrospora]